MPGRNVGLDCPSGLFGHVEVSQVWYAESLLS